MIQPPRLRWSLVRRPAWPLLAGLVVSVSLMAGLYGWKQSLDARRLHQAGQLDRIAQLSARATPRITPPLATPTSDRQWRDQAALLNRDWVRLTAALVPSNREVRLTDVDVNPATGAVRVVGQAPSRVVANAYAEALESHDVSLGRVRLINLEQRPDGIRFEVNALWLP